MRFFELFLHMMQILDFKTTPKTTKTYGQLLERNVCLLVCIDLSGFARTVSISGKIDHVVEGLSAKIALSQMLNQIFRFYVSNINVLEPIQGPLVENGPKV